MLPSPHRPLMRALTASALLHAALLLGAVTVFAPPLEMPATMISVAIKPSDRHAAAAAVATGTPVAQPSPAIEKPPEPRVRKIEREAVERRPEPPTASPAPSGSADAVAATLPAASASPSSSPSTPAPSIPAPLASAARGAGSGSPAPARPTVSADDLRQYSMSLGIAARRFKRYPALARERGWEGRAEVALIFSAVLPRPEVVLKRSSGRTVLDEQAIEMMMQATRVTSMPEGLQGRDFHMAQSVEFSLESDP